MASCGVKGFLFQSWTNDRTSGDTEAGGLESDSNLAPFPISNFVVKGYHTLPLLRSMAHEGAVDATSRTGILGTGVGIVFARVEPIANVAKPGKPEGRVLHLSFSQTISLS